MAYRHAVLVAAQVGATKVHVEVDNKGLAVMLNEKIKNMLVIGPIVEYTKKQLLGFDGVKAPWVFLLNLIDFGFKSHQIVFFILS